MTGEVRWFVGIDWAAERHQVCLLDVSGEPVGERSVLHGGGGLAEACDWLTGKTGAAPCSIAVAIEVPHGPVVEALLVNPKQLDRFSDRFSVAGAKDDRRDAQVLASALRTDRPAFRSLSLDDPLVIELRTLAGVAPVTVRSGKRCLVVRRYDCNRRLANTLYHWARVASQHDAACRRRYAALRQRGHSHG